MVLDRKKPVCGTCGNWSGKREYKEDGAIRVSASAGGRCQKLNKFKTSQGGCDYWTENIAGNCSKQENQPTRE